MPSKVTKAVAESAGRVLIDQQVTTLMHAHNSLQASNKERGYFCFYGVVVWNTAIGYYAPQKPWPG